MIEGESIELTIGQSSHMRALIHTLETKGSVVAAQDQLIVPKASHGGCLVSLSPVRDKETEDSDNNGRPCSASYSTGLRYSYIGNPSKDVSTMTLFSLSLLRDGKLA